MQSRDIIRQIATVLAIVAGIAINVLPFTGGGFGSGSDVGAISDRTNTLITPAGVTFAIWSLIFFGQLAFATYQALPSQRAHPLLRRVGWWVAFNGFGQGVWTLLFTNQQFVPAWLLIFALLGALIVASARTGLGRNTPTGRDYWLVYAPININLGWLSVASIINTAQVLQYVVGWNGAPFGLQFWAAAMIVVAAALGLVMVLRLGNLPFGAVIVWALAGIALRSADASLVLIVSIATAAAVALALLIGLVRRDRSAVLGGR
jgi:hypothetical protein